MAPGRGSIKIRVEPGNNNELEHLEESLEQMQQDFETELAEYEKTEQKLRRMKSNLLAADFMETFVHDDEEEHVDDLLHPGNHVASNNQVQTSNGSVRHTNNGNAPPPDLVLPRPLSQVVIESEVISPSKRFTHSSLGSPLSPDSVAREKMKTMWEKITHLETLLEEYRSGLRVRMEKIKKTENEIKTLSMNLNESRSPSRDTEFSRCSLPVSDHELSSHESVHSVPQNDEGDARGVEETSASGADFYKALSPNPEKQPLVEHSPAKLSIIESGDLKSAVDNTSPVSTMEDCSQQDVEVSMRDDVCMERFQISRKSWIMCIGVNVFVIFITVGFVIMANTR